jgi:hypothetical protein
MRCHHLLGLVLLLLATSTARAQLDPATGKSAATLLPPQLIVGPDETPRAQPPPLPPSPSPDTSAARSAGLPPKVVTPPIAPAPYNPTPLLYHDYEPQPYRGFDLSGATQPSVWVDTDYLLWWMRSGSIPILVTTSQLASAGILGLPGTVPLAGGSSVNLGVFSGIRLGLGCWIDEFQTIGLEGNWFTLGSRSWSLAVGNQGNPGASVVARPFFNAVSGSEDSELVAAGGLLAGTVQVQAATRLDGWEVNGLYNLACAGSTRVDLLAGFRSLDLNDGVTILEDVTVLPLVPGLGGSRFQVADEFHARSILYAGQLGARLLYQDGDWDVRLTGKVALGSTHEEVAISGMTGWTPPGGPTTVVPGGLLALPPNSGTYRRDVFAVVPEVGLSLGYQVTNWIHLGVGYSFLYWSNVARAGDQIDRVVIPLQAPALQGVGTAAAQPPLAFHGTDFWAHGLTFALEFRF